MVKIGMIAAASAMLLSSFVSYASAAPMLSGSPAIENTGDAITQVRGGWHGNRGHHYGWASGRHNGWTRGRHRGWR